MACGDRFARGRSSPRNPWLIVAILLGLSVLPGCGSIQRLLGAAPADDRPEATDPVQLQQELNLFASTALADIAGTGSEIASATEKRRIREQTLRWKIDAAEKLTRSITQSDARRSFLALWLMLAREHHALKDGPQSDLFGDHQEMAVNLRERQLQQIEKLGQRHFTPEMIDAAKDDVRELASKSMDAPGSASSTMSGPLSVPGDIGRLLTMPLTPFQGISDTPTAISQLAASTESFSTMTGNLSRRLRWETELLLLEVESLESVTDFREGLQRIVRTLERLFPSVENLPEELRQVVRELIAALERNQPELHATLIEAHQAAAELNEGLEKAGATAGEVSQVAAELSATAAAWQETAVAVRQLLAEWRDYQESLPPSQPDEKKTTVADYNALASKTKQAMAEARALLEDLRQTGRDQETITRLSIEATDLMNALTVRLALLIGLGFVAVLACRLVWVRIGRRDRQAESHQSTEG
ncbi:MAG: hypothetical protein ACOC7S_02470 [Planctomycetota bacterium]